MSEAMTGRFSLLIRHIPIEEATSAAEALLRAGIEGSKRSRRGVLVVPVTAETADSVCEGLRKRGIRGGELRLSVVQTSAPARIRFPPEILALARELELELGLSGVIYDEEP